MTAFSLRRTALSLTVVAALASVHGVGAQAQGGGRHKLAFIAIGIDGQPIAELKPEQVELKLDGKVRPLQGVKLVKLGSTGSAAAAPKAVFETSVPAPYGTNS